MGYWTPKGVEPKDYDDDDCIVLHLSISIALLTARVLRIAPDHSNSYRVGVYTLKRYRQLQVKDLPKVLTWRQRAIDCIYYIHTNIHTYIRTCVPTYIGLQCILCV